MSANQEALVSDLGSWTDNIRVWELQWRRNFFVWEDSLVQELMGQLTNVNLLRDGGDEWRFKYNKDGIFSCKMAYRVLIHNQMLILDPTRPITDEFFKKFWNPIIPLKIKALGWQLILDRAPSRLNLWKRGIIQDVERVLCVLCGSGVDTMEHLIFSCSKSFQLWKIVYNWAGVAVILPADG